MDCNRAQAIQAKSGTPSVNPSIWTNDISSGIRLDPGDSVSVHSAFINEIGSGADTIEFLGKYVTTTSLTYTTTSPTGPLSSEESVLYDNKVSIAISYYKNADADNVLILSWSPCRRRSSLCGRYNPSGLYVLLSVPPSSLLCMLV